MALSRHTLGKKHSTPPLMRVNTDPSEWPPDGGLSLTNIEHAWREGWDEDLVNPLAYEPFGNFVNAIRMGRGAILFGDCKIVRGDKRCPGRFPADHALYVNEIGPDGRYLVYDPADHNTSEGVRWVSEETLRRYAGNWTKVPNTINAAYTKITSTDGPGDPIPEEPKPNPLPAGCAGSLLSILGVIK